MTHKSRKGYNTIMNFVRTGGFGELTVIYEMGNVWEMKRGSPAPKHGLCEGPLNMTCAILRTQWGLGSGKHRV